MNDPGSVPVGIAFIDHIIGCMASDVSSRLGFSISPQMDQRG
jgi:hypothetical protein